MPHLLWQGALILASHSKDRNTESPFTTCKQGILADSQAPIGVNFQNFSKFSGNVVVIFFKISWQLWNLKHVYIKTIRSLNNYFSNDFVCFATQLRVTSCSCYCKVMCKGSKFPCIFKRFYYLDDLLEFFSG